MSEIKKVWKYPLVATSQDKRASRVTVRKPFSYELMGVDGSLEGGLRPFPGFMAVHQFVPGYWGANHDTSSTIVDFFVKDFIIGSDGYGFAIIYRVLRKNGLTGGWTAGEECDVFVDYYNSKLGRWVLGNAVMAGVPLPPDLDPLNGRQMSVSVWGRFIYVFIEDESPVAVSCERNTPWGFDLVSNTGPGLRPELISPEDSLPLGSIVDTGDDTDRPGKGQIFLTEFLPSEVGLGLGEGTGTTGISGTYGQDDEKITTLDQGDYSFAYVLYNSSSGRRSALSEVAQARKADFDPDGASGIFYVEIPLHAAIEICYDSTKYDQAYIYRSVRVQSAGGTYIASILHLDRIIDLANYWTSNNPLANPDHRQSIYWYELEDKQLVFQDTFADRSSFDENMPKAGASHWYENTMVLSSIRTAANSSVERNRKDDSIRGVGEMKWSSLTDVSPELFPPLNRYIPNVPSNTMLAMRQVGANVIGFSRDRQYHIRKESVYLKVQEMHEGFGVVNNYALDTVGSIIYFVSSKGLKAVDAQGQLDDVRSINEVILEDWSDDLLSISLAYDPYMSAVFVMNPNQGEACVFWLNTAKVTQLTDLPFRMCTRGTWPMDFIYDKDDLLNNFGINNDTYKYPLTERVFFIQNSPVPGSINSSRVTDFQFRMFMVDAKRQRVISGGSQAGEVRRTLGDFAGDSVFEVTGLSGEALTVDTTGKSIGAEIWGCELYVLDAADKTLIGNHATIKYKSNTSIITVMPLDAAQLTGLVAGDVVGISPIFFRWVGSCADVEGEDGQSDGEDFFRVRHFDSVGASFSDVTSNLYSSITPMFYRALAFTGASDTPVAYGYSKDLTGALVTSIDDGEGVYYAAFTDQSDSNEGKHGVDGSSMAPAVEIWIPDIDYRLLGIMVTGAAKPTSRTRRPS